LIILFIITSDVYEHECQRNLSNTHRLTRTNRMQRLTMEQKKKKTTGTKKFWQQLEKNTAEPPHAAGLRTG